MGLQEDIKELKEILLKNDEKKKEKKWKFPFGKKVGKSQRKKNYVCTLVILENGNYEFKKYQILDQTIMHDLIPRLATAGHVLHDKKGIPLIILPNWSVEPFSTLENYESTLINGSNTKGFKILMAKMLADKIEAKKKMAGWIKWVIGFIVVGGIIFALVSGGHGTTPTVAK